MTKPHRRQGKGAIEVIEEAVHLLRLSPPGTLVSYYVGSLPFLLGLLYFWGDMSRSMLDDKQCAVAALGLAVLFIWMKCWQTVFAVRLRTQIAGNISSPWTFRRIINLIAVQTAIQPWGFLAFPLSALIAIPLAWVYAFHQNVTVVGNGDTYDVKRVCKESWHQAKLWPMQNHVLLSILSLFGFFVFLNAAIGIFWLPQLLKTFLGIETLFTKSSWRVLNTTFLATTCAVTYLCMDPLMKAVYVLRCFYGDSMQSGADLRSELSLILRPQRLTVVLMLLGLAICPGETWGSEMAGSELNETVVRSGISAEELDRSISEVIQQREYRWRMPREKVIEEKQDKGLLATFIEAVADTLEGWLKKFFRWIKKIGKWIDEFFRKFVKFDSSKRSSSTSSWIPFLRGLMVVLLALLASILAVLFRRTWQRRRRYSLQTAGEAVVTLVPDLENDHITADELPSERWLLMAREMIGKGELRLALRAFYLASLAYLAQHERITIARFKSNHDYERELFRRAHEEPELLTAFAQNVILFDRVWYGMYPVTHEDVDHFAKNQERIRNCIES